MAANNDTRKSNPEEILRSVRLARRSLDNAIALLNDEGLPQVARPLLKAALELTEFDEQAVTRADARTRVQD